MISFDTPLFNIQERKRGYISALEQNGIAFNKDLLFEINSDDMNANVENAINELVTPGRQADALLFATNAIATHGLKHISRLNIQVPEQLALISFDKTDVLDLFYSPLTYINQPLPEMGRLATKILIEAIEGNKEITQINLPGELVIRSSTKAHHR